MEEAFRSSVILNQQLKTYFKLNIFSGWNILLKQELLNTAWIMDYQKAIIFQFLNFLSHLFCSILAEICPQNLQSIERQLRLTDLMTTYLTMLVGFSSATIVFFAEVKTNWFFRTFIHVYFFLDDVPLR